MAIVYVTGPVLHYISFPGQTTASFLGTAEFSPRYRIPKFYKKVVNDLSGAFVPFDNIYQGQMAQIVTELNRYNESIYALIAAGPRYGQGALANPRGAEGSLDIGAKVMGNSCFFTLYLQFPFSGTANSPPAEGMPGLYRFPLTILKSEDAPQMGTKDRKISLMFEANNIYYPASTGGALAGGFFLYDNTTGGVTLPPPN